MHLMFVTLCLMVAYAASDPYSFHLSEATKKLCMQNGITNSYFDAKAYAEELEDGTFRTVNDAEGVSGWQYVRALRADARNLGTMIVVVIG